MTRAEILLVCLLFLFGFNGGVLASANPTTLYEKAHGNWVVSCQLVLMTFKGACSIRQRGETASISADLSRGSLGVTIHPFLEAAKDRPAILRVDQNPDILTDNLPAYPDHYLLVSPDAEKSLLDQLRSGKRLSIRVFDSAGNPHDNVFVASRFSEALEDLTLQVAHFEQ